MTLHQVQDIFATNPSFKLGTITELESRNGESNPYLFSGVSRIQKDGRAAVFIDLLDAFNWHIASEHGVDHEMLFVINPQQGDLLSFIEEIVESTEAVGIFVIKSTSAFLEHVQRESNVNADDAIKKLEEIVATKNGQDVAVVLVTSNTTK